LVILLSLPVLLKLMLNVFMSNYYRFVYEKKNITEAQRYCREKHTNLASIDSMQDVNILTAMVNRTQLQTSGSGSVSFISTNVLSYFEDCGMMLSDGMWNDESCAVLQLPICINIFILMNKLMNWNEAQKYCRERYTDLVSVRNSEENQKVKDLIPDRRGAWIGLFKDDWKWLDGSNSTFRNWEKTQPNNNFGSENCAVMSFGQHGKWHDWPCTEEKAFICYGRS
uniref:C-type lectin domain-containing protein n=1 Tax=Echeneis naucrates TaxID=173247 RepID=A0A665U5S5_ECHNA